MKEQRTENGSQTQNYKEDVAYIEQVLTFLIIQFGYLYHR